MGQLHMYPGLLDGFLGSVGTRILGHVNLRGVHGVGRGGAGRD